ncbi:hypothetical protein [Primorskyibacter sp. S187A]|uniref:hypothetical protein n=1 Tax=Primorskyibacter sp. S187A TaxID=3415130 RepID=UPI003C7AF392
MKQILLIMGLVVLASGAQAACYADYKAKKDSPLRLHYGVAQVAECSRAGAANELQGRLARQGWTLLNVLGVFDESGLAERAENAGRFYLRY